MNLELLLSTLDKVRSNGKGRYQACCPSHADKSPSLQITDNGQRILIHCFAGCTSDEILAACGLDHGVLYPDDDKPYVLTEKMAQKRAEKEKEQFISDELFYEIFKTMTRQGHSASDQEIQRYRGIVSKKYRRAL